MNFLPRYISEITFSTRVVLIFLAMVGVFGINGYAANLAPQAEAILKKARKFIAPESVLNSVHSLRFTGTITNPKGEKGKIVIVLQKPYKLVQSVEMPNGIVDEFGLNDYEGWRKQYKAESPDRYGLASLDVSRLKRLRANTFESLNYFSVETSFSRKIEYLGKQDLEGKQVEVVKFVYGPAHFIRYIDAETGQLLLSESEVGEKIKEEGEMMVKGIRFPKQLITMVDGKLLNRLEFTHIEVNPELDPSMFTLPPLPGTKK